MTAKMVVYRNFAIILRDPHFSIVTDISVVLSANTQYVMVKPHHSNKLKDVLILFAEIYVEECLCDLCAISEV